jgi:hypothetical protein
MNPKIFFSFLSESGHSLGKDCIEETQLFDFEVGLVGLKRGLKCATTFSIMTLTRPAFF